MKNNRYFALRASLACLLAGAPVLFGAPVTTGPDVNPSAVREAAELLSDIRENAAALSKDAGALQVWSLGNALTWESHATELQIIRDDVNVMGKELAKLEEIRGSAAPWEQQAIDRTEPLLRELAANTKNAIQFVNDNRDRLYAPEYHNMVSNLFNESTKLRQSVRDFERLEKTRQHESQLEQTLGMKAGS